MRLTGLTHSFRGDLHVFIADPAGVRYNVVVRPGYIGSGLGDSGDFNLGTYDFIGVNGGNVAQGATDIDGGPYLQYLNTGAGQWTSGTYVIHNAPLNSITGPAGLWTLSIVDWVYFDQGSITGWTLEGTDGVGWVNFCGPGSGGILPCPCGNPPSGANRGCDNFGAGSGGASITGTGNPSLSADTVSLTIGVMNSTSLGILFQGKNPVSPTGVVNGAGIRCVSATLKRLYTGNAVNGVLTRPGMGDPSVSARSAAVHDPIAAGEARRYFSIYRDPGASGPCGNTASTVNLSNAGTFVWGP